jgi:hypothetical protein
MEVAREKLDALGEALQAAKNEDRTYKEIANLCGVTYASIRNFRTSGSLGLKNANRLEDWLVKEGFMTESTVPRRTLEKGDPAAGLAALLRNLADLVDNSNIPHQDRVQLARLQLQTAEHLISIVAAFEPPAPVK